MWLPPGTGEEACAWANMELERRREHDLTLEREERHRLGPP